MKRLLHFASSAKCGCCHIFLLLYCAPPPALFFMELHYTVKAVGGCHKDRPPEVHTIGLLCQASPHRRFLVIYLIKHCQRMGSPLLLLNGGCSLLTLAVVQPQCVGIECNLTEYG